MGGSPDQAMLCVDELEVFGEERNGSYWLLRGRKQHPKQAWRIAEGTPIPRDIVREQWPHRKLKDFAATQRARGVLTKITNNTEPAAAVAHFDAVFIEEHEQPEGAHPNSADLRVFQVKIGDCVAVGSEDNTGDWVCEVQELFEDELGKRWAGVTWFYRPLDTALRVDRKKPLTGTKRRATAEAGEEEEEEQEMDEDGTPAPSTPLVTESGGSCTGGAYVPVFDEGRNRGANTRLLWRASLADNNSSYPTAQAIDSISRVVKVKQVQPGEAPPSAEEADYWWTQQHDRKFITFCDPPDFVPPSRKFAEERAARGEKRVIRALDLYCGCGGLSFIDGEYEQDGVSIRTQWAVDFNASAAAGFRVNYPEAQVHQTGVDEYLWLCRHFKELCDEFQQDDWEEQYIAGRLLEEEESVAKGQYEVEAVLDMQLDVDDEVRSQDAKTRGQIIKDLDATNCRLQFLIRWKGYDEASDTWEPLENVVCCRRKVRDFVFKWRDEQRVPLPGQVDIVMGGPPCQGMSGLNRHAKRVDVLQDCRNRQVNSFYAIVDHLQPGFVLMENVVDMLAKENGLYAKFATARLLQLEYQTRIGIIPAGEHGVAQSRFRVFLWGAKSGVEQLPAFPEPTHQTLNCQRYAPKAFTDCRVTWLKPENEAKAYPPVLLWDVLSDLPPVTNFKFAERNQYSSKPLSPFQTHIRRDPPAWQASRKQRADAADAEMSATQENVNGNVLAYNDRFGAESFSDIGNEYLNQQDTMLASKKPNHSQVTLRATQQTLEEAEEGAGDAWHTSLFLSREALCVEVGEQVVAGAKAAAEAQKGGGPLRDHRPLCLQMDDQLRLEAVPKNKHSNFRLMQGIQTWTDGTCCAGHTHAAKQGRSSATLCPGGGNRMQPKSTNDKTGRVDHHEKALGDKAWVGAFFAGCTAGSAFLPTGNLVCPRWAITYKRGKSGGRHGCYGRAWWDETQPTVVGRAEPHNLALCHPEQDRVFTIRENARCQGFPDYFALVGLSNEAQLEQVGLNTWVRHKSLTERYQQMGNAVSPAVASALGRCLARAAVGKSPQGQFVISVPDPVADENYRKAREAGLQFYVEQQGGREGIRREQERRVRALRKTNTGLVAAIEATADDDDDDELAGASMGEC